MSHEHRPYPAPTQPFIMHQRWNDLLFMHWPVEPAVLREVLPQPLSPDIYEGKAWLGVVPFWMDNVRPRFVPPLPGLSKFAELNVRTYVTRDQKPGVYFFSLDAANRLAVYMARLSYSLPYYFAKMTYEMKSGEMSYLSQRADARSRLGNLDLSYRPTGPVFRSTKGSLDYFLTERYCLYTVHKKRGVCRCEIDHLPWPLQLAEATVRENSMTQEIGVELQGSPLLHFAKSLDVKIWPLVPCP